MKDQERKAKIIAWLYSYPKTRFDKGLSDPKQYEKLISKEKVEELHDLLLHDLLFDRWWEMGIFKKGQGR